MGPNSRSVHFLKDFGHFLLERYNPKAILVFSAHWESDGETLVSNWGEQRNPLYYDYYGFPKQMFTEIGFKSRGDDALSKTVVSAIQQAGLKARLSGPEEKRGRDGLGQLSTGLDHGVFVPLSLMFPGHGLANPGDTQFDIPVIQASINGSLTAEDNEALGKAVSALRSEGVLVLSGGLTVHTFEDFSAFTESGAKEIYKQWDQAIVDAVNLPQSSQERHKALRALLNHPGCKLAHPRLEHCALKQAFSPMLRTCAKMKADTGSSCSHPALCGRRSWERCNGRGESYLGHLWFYGRGLLVTASALSRMTPCTLQMRIKVLSQYTVKSGNGF